MLKQLFCFLMALAIVGCAGKSMREQDLAQMKRIAVFSVLGTKANHRYIGTTVFQNKDNTIDVAAWRIDESISRKMMAALKENSSLAKVDVLKGQFGQPKITRGWQEPFVAEAKKQGFDTLIVVVPASYTNAAAFPPGYGILRQSSFGITHTNAYMLAQVQIFNVASGELVGWHFTYDDIAGKPNLTASAPAPWKENPAAYSKAEMTELQNILSAHAINAAVYALNALKVTPAKYKP